MALGVYISVPFCRTKCSYCNFASDVFSRVVFECYVDRVCADIANAPLIAEQMGGRLEREVDSIYMGGGTPTVLEAGQLERIFAAVRSQFEVQPDAEVTVECAPGTLSPTVVDGLLRCGVNRVSLGVQSFVDIEAAAVGLAETIATGAPHASVYMLEVDDDSRLGRELMAGGTRYHAHFVPDEDATADFYETAREQLNAVGLAQYEISNFARSGCESRHNLKYWTRQPYIGFGVDAHTMLLSLSPQASGVRFATPDSLEQYVAGARSQPTIISRDTALEDSFFLGLRLNRGIDLRELTANFGEAAIANARECISELVETGLMERAGNIIGLTSKGRLLSNEVFERFISLNEVVR